MPSGTSPARVVALALLLVAALAGCGGGDPPPTDAGPGRDAALAFDAGPGSASGESAEQLYARLCASCHGDLGEGGLGPSLVDSPRTVEELTSIIDERMPQGAPNRCDGTCPRVLAEYILRAFTSSALSCEGGVPPSPRRLRLLSRREYRATVRELLRLPTDEGMASACNVRTFRYTPSRSVTSVHVAGTFNGWSPSAWPMTRQPDGSYLLEREIANGTYPYKFVLDGTEWVIDPANPTRVDDGYGGQNSVLTVDCGASGSTAPIDPAASLPVETRTQGYFFDTDAPSGVVTPVHVREELKAARVSVEAARPMLSAIVGCDLGADRSGCVSSFVRTFGRRAFRRPLTDAERARYEALATSTTDANAGVELAIRAMLVSPAFLYRSEMGHAQAAGTYSLDAYELASALSYQLWGTMPDDALLDAAERGELVDLASREREARRLLADPRARERVADFAEMWLGIEEVAAKTKNASVYPTWSTDLGEDLREETRRFVTYVVFDSSHGLGEMFTSDQSFVNERLARHYGIAGVSGESFVRATLPAGQRAGLLSHGSVLATTAHSDQSSPIRRGLFVRQRLLCQSFPLPPADAGGVPDVDPSATTRERFAQHTASPRCAGCHQYIDPIGFGFEAFDGIGAFRTTEGGRAIDTSGGLSDVEGLGTHSDAPFSTMPELGAILASAEQPAACFVEQYFRFARGYPEGVADHCAIDALLARYRATGDLRELLVGVVLSPDFATRTEVTR
ncbi:MAG: DUF1592 domain-containing protein [Sandaracinaceae bacterium]|nr:DUF1592 domain-containing protein [Sandaracinaceae bacterium]